MARRHRAIVAAACATILVGVPALASAGGRGEPDPVDDARAALIEQIRDQAARAEDELAQLEQRIGVLGKELVVLESSGLATGPSLQLQGRRFAERSEGVREGVMTWTPSDATTLGELSEPLETVVQALHAGDEYAMALVDRMAEVAGRRTGLEQLEAELRQTRFDMAGDLGGLRGELAAALQAVHSAGGDAFDASDAIRQTQELMGRIQTAELTLRQDEARIRYLSVALGDEQASLLALVEMAQVEMDALNAQMAAVERLVGEELASWPDGPFPFERVDGVLEVCPVDPPRAYSDDFGAPRWSGGYHAHQGNDIFAPSGTPIRAPFDGIAVAVPNALGGDAVKVYGAAGYVYNAHLSAYGKLGEVVTGDIIGYVGNSGNAIQTPPHNHFEWHPGNGPAVNPFTFLNAACLPPA